MLSKIKHPAESPGKSEILDSTSYEKSFISNLVLPLGRASRSLVFWDGTYLGVILDNQILQRFNDGKFEYWTLVINGQIITCSIKSSKNYTQCLIDELKPLFGLVKLGTHYANYRDKYVILVRARTTPDGKFIVSDYTLNNDKSGELPEYLIPRLREIYVFRDLLGLNKSTDSSITIRKSDDTGELFAVSLIDSHIKKERLIDLTVSTYLPDTVFNKWFKDESPIQILKRMCLLLNKNKVTNVIYKLRNDIEKVVRRVCDREYADLPDMLIAKISQKLQHL